ncbi:MAG: hypothetical protein ABR591_06495 [Candidatus Velthaea sp.]
MRFSRLISAAALASLCVLPVAAGAQPAPQAPQNGAAPAGARHHRSAFMHALRTLNLSPQQKDQIKSLVQQSRSANQNADPSARRANREKLHADINGVLTPAQRTQLQAEIERERREPAAPRS